MIHSIRSSPSRFLLFAFLLIRVVRARPAKRSEVRAGDFDAWYGNNRRTEADREDTARARSLRGARGSPSPAIFHLAAEQSCLRRFRGPHESRGNEREKERHAWQLRNQSSRLLAGDAEEKIMRTYVYPRDIGQDK